jgi:predicted DNA-binding transcriptional regulator YafY
LYVVGYDHTVKHWPIFKLARIRTLTLSDNFYEVQHFSAEEYFKNSLGIMVGDTEQTVRIRLTGHAFITANEQMWPPGFTLQAKSQQEGILSGRVTSMGDLIP